MRPPVAELLVGPLRDLGSADPERDAVVVGDATFGRLDHYLGAQDPTQEDIDHVVDFCLAGVRRAGPAPASPRSERT